MPWTMAMMMIATASTSMAVAASSIHSLTMSRLLAYAELTACPHDQATLLRRDPRHDELPTEPLIASHLVRASALSTGTRAATGCIPARR